jgi:hypothetical protein
MNEPVDTIQLWGAACFGALIGWHVFFINRYRKSDVQFSDLVTLVGVIGGAAVLAIFPAKSALFGAYGIGLAAGFFGYFLVLVVLVGVSKKFGSDWFLDGRRKQLDADEMIDPTTASTVHTMGGGPGPQVGGNP